MTANLPPETPAFLVSLIDESDAHCRDRLTASMRLYREHVTEEHDGEPSACGRAFVAMSCDGLTIATDGGLAHLGEEFAPIIRHNLAQLFAYTVERLFIAERELARYQSAAQ